MPTRSAHFRPSRQRGSSLWLLLLTIVVVAGALTAPLPNADHRTAPAEQNTVDIA